MREIKFRVWNVSSRKFVDFGVGGLRSDYTLNDLFCDNFDDDLSNYKIQQYTGLKDKNGKEVYEGDILKHDIGLGPLYWQVIWESVTGQWRINKEHGGNTGGWFDCYEIAGNIFENPELLEYERDKI